MLHCCTLIFIYCVHLLILHCAQTLYCFVVFHSGLAQSKYVVFARGVCNLECTQRSSTVAVSWLLSMLMISTIQHVALLTPVKFLNGTLSRQAYSATLAGGLLAPAPCINISFSFLASCATVTLWIGKLSESVRHWLLSH